MALLLQCDRHIEPCWNVSPSEFRFLAGSYDGSGPGFDLLEIATIQDRTLWGLFGRRSRPSVFLE